MSYPKNQEVYRIFVTASSLSLFRAMKYVDFHRGLYKL